MDPTSAEEITEIRRSVAALCERFGNDYWRELDRARNYPSEFVNAMTEAGFLGVLVPECYGGVGQGLVVAANILEEVHACGANAAALRSEEPHV